MTDPLHDITVDFVFEAQRPGFGDLFLICGVEHPRFPPEGQIDFRPLANLQVSQVDDYFGVRALADTGDDVAIWLFPTVDGEPVDHHPGPFDGLQLAYSLLRNPPHRLEHYLSMIEAFQKTLPAKPMLAGKDTTTETVREIAETALQEWQARGITPGSPQALAIDL